MDNEQIEKVVVEVVKDSEKKYRDERGVRLQTYRRFKQDVDYLPADTDAMVAMVDVELQNRKQGRPPKFYTVEELEGAITAYWQYIRDCSLKGIALIPDVEGLATFIGVCRDTLNEWERSNYRGFSATIKEAKNSIASVNKQLAKQGRIPAVVFAIDFNNNHGYTQKQEIKVEQQSKSPYDDIDEIALQKRIEGTVVVDEE